MKNREKNINESCETLNRKRSNKKGYSVDILLEVNVAEEENKYGFKMEKVISVIKIISKFTHIRIRGLMTLAPYVQNSEENRENFSK